LFTDVLHATGYKETEFPRLEVPKPEFGNEKGNRVWEPEQNGTEFGNKNKETAKEPRVR
jgi:hypothetical protein